MLVIASDGTTTPPAPAESATERSDFQILAAFPILQVVRT
jgi:hypothetical protein